jgi:hypothetical protein
MFVAMLTMLLSRRRVLLGVLVLPVRVVMGRLQVVMRGRVMMCCGLMVMLDGRMFGLLWHGFVLCSGIGDRWAVCAQNTRPQSARR